jgi:hypothetical protein
MIDHLGLNLRDLKHSRAFYDLRWRRPISRS